MIPGSSAWPLKCVCHTDIDRPVTLPRISANCIATVIYDTGIAPWTFFVSADGEHYYWNNNQNTGVISAGRADRVSKALLVP